MAKFEVHTYVIVENEFISAHHLRTIMDRFFPTIDLIQICETADVAIEVLREFKPDLIFMDVYLDEDKTCFDVLDAIPPDDHKIIFITKSDKHAEQAFEHNAVEYIRKPYQAEELKKAIKKAEKMQFLISTDMEDARIALKDSDRSNHLCNIQSGEKIIRIPFSHIFTFKGGNKGSHKSFVYLENDKFNEDTLLTSKMLGKLDDYHDLPSSFFRVRSFYFNTNHIKEIIRKSLIVVFTNGGKIKLSRNEFSALMDFLGID